MITWKKALDFILKNTPVLKEEKTDITKTTGMILAEDIYSGIRMPPFDKSAVDGYALKAEDTKNIPAQLKCIGVIQAGHNFTKEVKHNQCIKIMTGAPIPKGANAIVMIENTLSQNDHIKINSKVTNGDNICLQGEDIKYGRIIARKDTLISPSHISLLSAVGKKYVGVRQKPKVAVLNTGGEIIPAGNILPKNKIYNSNGPQLLALLKTDGLEPIFLGIVKDDFEKLTAVIRQGLKNDILLISGGVSMGDYDLIPKVLKKLGVKEIFHKIKIKPGKPLFFGVRGKTLVFGIPGNPVSNFLVYQIFIRPAIYKMRGYKNSGNIFKRGILEKDFLPKNERTHFVLINISVNPVRELRSLTPYRDLSLRGPTVYADSNFSRCSGIPPLPGIPPSGFSNGVKQNHYYLKPVNSHGSADIFALSNADGFMVIEPTKRYLSKETLVDFITWKNI